MALLHKDFAGSLPQSLQVGTQASHTRLVLKLGRLCDLAASMHLCKYKADLQRADDSFVMTEPLTH